MSSKKQNEKNVKKENKSMAEKMYEWKVMGISIVEMFTYVIITALLLYLLAQNDYIVGNTFCPPETIRLANNAIPSNLSEEINNILI